MRWEDPDAILADRTCLQPIAKEPTDGIPRAFVLQHVLSESECAALILAGQEFGFEHAGLGKKLRNNERLLMHSDRMAAVIWERISPFLDDAAEEIIPHSSSAADASFFGPDPAGKWSARGLNPRFRLCKYSPGGHFGPHIDGCYQRSAHERSMLTCMVYLNGDGIVGGATHFLDTSDGSGGCGGWAAVWWEFCTEVSRCMLPSLRCVCVENMSQVLPLTR